ncbi:prephenate dehydratase [Inmirania thermothiophila]|uniref:Bifunctional chorismate mutase/prephenate dehydratase n=1 Tax=Inmirania thermothiophila TaxID=1750597 RepID=A0A3N1Y3W2_9GAMM|nr:prephenate dehydratase [Inmirania thermothiophila]ROR32292.1 chorismate mutase [Inmirania thermothiophila]
MGEEREAAREAEIGRIREEIDRLDEQIQALITRRAECARRIAEIKKEAGDAEAFFYRPEREAQILRRVLERNRGPLSDEEMARLFREIMSACLALEQPLNVAFLGPEGTFTQLAAFKHFGHSIRSRPLPTIDEVFREVEAGSVHYGVVPVENSTEGMVSHTLDRFLNSPLYICGEVELRVHHYLMAVGGRIEDIRRVYSHRQSLAQCREWLDAHLPQAERIAVESNAEAARRASRETRAAAIAGEATAHIYRLRILASNIEDEPENTTRFLVIGRQQVPPSGNDKTSLLLSAPNRPGALFRLLEPLARHGVSMTRIESRPSRRGLWDYVFFVDVEGHRSEDKVAAALAELEREASLFRVLGSYPRAVL